MRYLSPLGLRMIMLPNVLTRQQCPYCRRTSKSASSLQALSLTCIGKIASNIQEWKRLLLLQQPFLVLLSVSQSKFFLLNHICSLYCQKFSSIDSLRINKIVQNLNFINSEVIFPSIGIIFDF